MNRNANTYKIAISLMTPARPEEVETLMEGLQTRGITVTIEEMIDLLTAGADGGFVGLYKGWARVLRAHGDFVVKEVAYVGVESGLPEASFPYLLHDEGGGIYTEWDDPSEVHSGGWIMDVE